MVAHIFNPRTGQAEADGSLSLRPTWSAEQVSGQSSLGSEGQKAGEDVIAQGCHVPATASRTWQIWPHGSGFRKNPAGQKGDHGERAVGGRGD